MRKETIEVLVIEPNDQLSDYQQESWMHPIVFRESKERGPELYSCRTLPRNGAQIGANEIAQAPPAQDNQKAEKMTAGGCLPRPCSACGSELSENSILVRERNPNLDKCIFSTEFEKDQAPQENQLCQADPNTKILHSHPEMLKRPEYLKTLQDKLESYLAPLQPRNSTIEREI